MKQELLSITILELIWMRRYIFWKMRLKEVVAGYYFFILAPLKLKGIEAAPARAILLGF
ncbi:hypothetical protein AB4114_14265 [Paenibacillus sp. 2RAB27]|uniref:hypothetical protein n=1 Tax=Paenibacillus sp. 2RAB27 TaxID=3232991 RepID=UPI003F9DAED1